MPFAGEQDGAPTVLCHAHHVAAALYEYGFQRVEENPVVVRDQDPNGTFAAAFAKTQLGCTHRVVLKQHAFRLGRVRDVQRPILSTEQS